MRRTILALSALSFLAVPTAASAGGGCHEDGPAQETHATRVDIEHACFMPTVATVAPGTKVTFVNSSGLDHNITGPAIEFRELPNGATFERTFDEPGVYVYACLIHPGMSGAVIVRGGGASVAPVASVAAPAAPAAAAPDLAPASSSEPATDLTGWAVAAVAILAAGAVVLVTRVRAVAPAEG